MKYIVPLLITLAIFQVPSGIISKEVDSSLTSLQPEEVPSRQLVSLESFLLTDIDSGSYSSPINFTSPMTQNERLELTDTGALNLWQQGLRGQGVKVAVIDSGINFDHTTFSHLTPISYSFVTKENGFPEDEDFTDYLGHGTAVASLIAGNGAGSDNNIYTGIAPNATLISLKVANKDGFITVKSVVKAIEFAVTLDVDIINLSLGAIESTGELDIMEKAVTMATNAGITVVASAGNEGTGGSSVRDPFTVKTPSSAPDAISVGNIDFSRNLHYSSSEGPSQLLQIKPDVVVYGSSVMTATGTSSYTQRSGTSFSTPIISGLVALIASGNTPGMIKSALLAGAENIGTSERPVLFPNISRSYELLKSESVYVSQSVLKSTLHSSIPRGETFLVHTSLVAPQKNLTWTVKGDFSYISLKQMSGTIYTQFLTLAIDTTEFQQGIHEIDVIVRSSMYSITLTISFNVTKPANLRGILDLRHTGYDSVAGIDRAIGWDMRQLFDYFSSLGVWVTESFDKFSKASLEDIDLIILPDAFVKIIQSDALTNFSDVILEPDEYSALADFVYSGGKILMDFGGLVSSNYAYLIEDQQPLENSLAHFLDLFGMQTTYSSMSTLIRIGEVVNSSTLSSLYSYPVGGSHPIMGGVPFVKIGEKTTSSLFIGSNGGAAVIMSSRAWRTPSELRRYNIDFSTQSPIADWLFNNDLSLEAGIFPNGSFILSFPNSYSVIDSSTNFLSQSGNYIFDSDRDVIDVNYFVKKGSQFVNSSILFFISSYSNYSVVESGDKVLLDVDENYIADTEFTVYVDGERVPFSLSTGFEKPKARGEHQIFIVWRDAFNSFRTINFSLSVSSSNFSTNSQTSLQSSIFLVMLVVIGVFRKRKIIL